jgi:hypothetical protein
MDGNWIVGGRHDCLTLRLQSGAVFFVFCSLFPHIPLLEERRRLNLLLRLLIVMNSAYSRIHPIDRLPVPMR